MSEHKKSIDLRSDTVTKPTPEMRKAMSEAEVGDDVFGDDPTVIKLEQLAAQMLGKEAGLFVPSGTMGNLIAIMVHCDRRGSEMILGDQSHIHFYEQGGCSGLAGVHPRTVKTQPNGTLDLKDLEFCIRGNDVHYPVTRLICLENTHNRMGGRVLTPEYTDSVAALAHKHGLKLHMDGARLFNAVVKLGVDPARLVQGADSVSLCLSKGLAAPVGSVLLGTKEFIAQARRTRKALGGGLRQAGVLATCGIISLTKMVDRLKEDHDNASALARQLNAVPGIKIDVESVETNIVFLDISPDMFSVDATFIASELKALGVLCVATASHRMRLVTNYHFTSEDVATVVGAFDRVLKANRK